MSTFQIDSDPRDGNDFDLLATLIDAESRGSKLAKEMRLAILDYDDLDAQQFHEEIRNLVQDTRVEILEIFDGFGKDIDEDFDEDEVEELSEYLTESTSKFFERNQKNLKLETLSLLLEEYYESTQEFGAFGNSKHLLDYSYFRQFSLWGLGVTPFISRRLLWDVTVGAKQIWSGGDGACACGCTWGYDSSESLAALVFSPVISGRLLSEIIREQLKNQDDFRWIGIPLLLNANLTLEDLALLATTNQISNFAYSYCLGARVGGAGVCGSLLELGLTYPISTSGESLFGTEDDFLNWEDEDLVGEFDEEIPEDNLVRVLVGIADLYLSTEKGMTETTWDLLGKSETFGKILISYRMVEEFKSGRAKIDDALNSNSRLVRTLLYWYPELEQSKRDSLKELGVEEFDDQVGAVIAQAWSARPRLLV